MELIGPGGLLTELTRTVLETALEAEMSGEASDHHRGSPRSWDFDVM